MPKPVCVPCRLFYVPVKNDAPFVEGAPGPHAAPASRNTCEVCLDVGEPFGRRVECTACHSTGRTVHNRDGWHPYKLWLGDLWRCRGCGHEIIVGTGANPVAEAYLADNFDLATKAYPPIITVNDC